ncbi:MAG: NADH-quinone oxidoreductase subunit H [Spirochaetaceae bacterium]|nr:MAG: NADH-quinone oxidoreductase subunit H [Spirochaetaceae bacterium]
MIQVIFAAGFVVIAPFAGGMLAGLDRIITARMQGRKGPPIIQPFWDVAKLLRKENLIISRYQQIYLYCFLIFTVFTGALFFSGGDFLIVLFAFTLADIFFIMSGFVANSPYSHIGSERELIQMMAHEPVVLLSAVGMYIVTGNFHVSAIAGYPEPLLVFLPGIFISFIFILLMKLRKSPFDLSMSHHAHQELVRGIITEYSGRTLAIVEISHWYENVLLFSFLYLFFASSPIISAVILLLVFFLQILIDNSTSRLKYEAALKVSWMVTIGFGVLNILILALLKNLGAMPAGIVP